LKYNIGWWTIDLGIGHKNKCHSDKYLYVSCKSLITTYILLPENQMVVRKYISERQLQLLIALSSNAENNNE
jgi:hypothetical protein